MNGTFLTLNPKEPIFEELRKQPDWWTLFQNDSELYIEIRKDNYINVYYYGGSLAKIKYENGFIAETHQKYLGDNLPRRTKKGNDIYEYDLIDLGKLDIHKISEIKKRIKCDYLKQINEEKPPEKWIQGKMISENKNFIDSEFQFNQDHEIGKLRIDLVELYEGVLTFVELKGIFDNRLRVDINRNSKEPEIIEQMKKYELFINKYETEIIGYYKKLLEIKKSLFPIYKNAEISSVNKIPKLIIANTYKKKSDKRDERINDIENLLKKININFEIIKWKS